MNSTQSDFLDELFSEIEESIRRYRHVSAASGISSLSLLKAHIKAERDALAAALKDYMNYHQQIGHESPDEDILFLGGRAALAKAGVE